MCPPLSNLCQTTQSLGFAHFTPSTSRYALLCIRHPVVSVLSAITSYIFFSICALSIVIRYVVNGQGRSLIMANLVAQILCSTTRLHGYIDIASTCILQYLSIGSYQTIFHLCIPFSTTQYTSCPMLYLGVWLLILVSRGR